MNPPGLELPMAAAIDSHPLKPNIALLELSLLNAETSSASFDDIIVEALKRVLAGPGNGHCGRYAGGRLGEEPYCGDREGSA